MTGKLPTLSSLTFALQSPGDVSSARNPTGAEFRKSRNKARSARKTRIPETKPDSISGCILCQLLHKQLKILRNSLVAIPSRRIWDSWSGPEACGWACLAV